MLHFLPLNSSGNVILAPIANVLLDQQATLTLPLSWTGWSASPRIDLYIGSTKVNQVYTPAPGVKSLNATYAFNLLGALIVGSNSCHVDFVDTITGRILDSKSFTVTLSPVSTNPLAIVDSGYIPNGGSLPTSLAAGDRIMLVGITAHDIAVNKEIVVPTGYTQVRRWSLTDAQGQFIPDGVLAAKVAVTNDIGATVTFTGDTTVGIHYLITRNGGAITAGDGVWSYAPGTFNVPSIDPASTGLHAVVIIASGSAATISSNPPGFVQQTTRPVGFSSASLYTKTAAPDPTGAVPFSVTGTSPSIHAFSWHIEGIAPAASAPDAVDDLVGNGTNTQAVLSWSAPPANGSPITSYTVQRRIGAGSWATIGTPSVAAYTDTGLTNGTQYQYRVYAVNGVGTSLVSNTVTVTPTDTYAAPTAPDLSTTGATVVNPTDNLATLAANGSENQVFHLSNTTTPYTNVSNVVPKAGQKFIGTVGATINGGGTSTKSRAFKGEADNVVIANLKLTNFGQPGSTAQNIGVIDAKSGEWDEGTNAKGANWTIWNCEIYDNANTGLWLGDNWTVAYGQIRNHSPQGIGGGFGVGGLIYGVSLIGNGENGAGGAAVNNAQIKLAFWNVGPWGDTAHDTSRFKSTFNGAAFTSDQHNYATPNTIQIVDCTFNIRNGVRTKALWFDLDCRDVEMAHCTVSDSTAGFFNEGGNGYWVHDNTFTRCGNAAWLSSGTYGTSYFGAAAVVSDVSSNGLVEDNTFVDCSQMSIIAYLGERGRAGADWVTSGSEYATAYSGFMIRNNFACIEPGDASNVGSCNHIFRNNTLTGSSVGVGFVYGGGINKTTEAHRSTHEAYGNDYGATALASNKFFEDGAALTFAQWQAKGFDLGGNDPDPDPGGDSLQTIASGILANGSNLPSAAQVGDQIAIVGLSNLDVVANKAMTVPAGFPAGTTFSAPDYISNLLGTSKTLISSDLNTPITFGGTVPVTHYLYAIIRGADNIKFGTNSTSYTGTASLPAITGEGTHVIFSALGQTNSVTPTITGYTVSQSTTPGYQGAAVFTRTGAANPSASFNNAGSTTSVNAVGVLFEGTTGPVIPSVASAITNLTATAGDAQVTLNWAQPNLNNGTLTRYRIDRQIGGTWTNNIAPSHTTTAFTDTGRTNGTTVSYRVYTINSVGTSPVSNVAAATPSTSSVPSPNLSLAGAINVTPSTNLANAIAAAPAGAVFALGGGTYTANNLFPKQGQRFIANASNVTFNGQGTSFRAFRGDADDVTIHGIDFVNWTDGNFDQYAAVIDFKADFGTEGSLVTAHDWHIDSCTFDNCKVGIALGHRFIVTNCDFEGCNPQAISSAFVTGGIIDNCTFRDNGYVGAPGGGVNNAQIKLHWHNIGPWGVTAHDTSRFKVYNGSALFNTNMHNYEPPQDMLISNCTFTGTRNTAKYGSGDGARAIWMDLDVRDVRVTNNTFNDTWWFGVFVEGCNGIEVDNNTFNKSRTPWYNSYYDGIQRNGAYFNQGAVVADVSDNIYVHDNIFSDCQGCITFFLGDRGRPPADWVTEGGFNWPVASDSRNQMIRRTYAPINPGEASTVGASNSTAINNTLTNGSYGIGWVVDDSNLPSEYNLSTFDFQGNTYPAGVFRGFWNKIRYDSLTAWRNATGFDV